jgi:protein TonB
VTSSPVTFEPPNAPLAPREEPLATVLDLGGREDRLVFGIALAAALAVHAVAGARAARVFPYLAELAASVRAGLQERLRSQVDIDMNEPPPPPKPEPEPEPEPDPEPPPAAQQKAPEFEAPPAAAEAAPVLTAEADPDAPVDLTDQGFVTGTSDRFSGGVTAAAGTSKKAVHNPAAVATGIGTGTPKAKVVAGPTVDLSRGANVLDPGAWLRCPFPPESEAEGINNMKVKMVVTVRPDGRASGVTIVNDPGFGFGKAARACGLRNVYSPALNAEGKPIEQTITVNMKFTR